MAIAVTPECKMVSISPKRQITIPQVFFNTLGFETEAECILKNNELIIRPVKKNVSYDFSEQILTDLVCEGFSGQELLDEFKNRQAKIKPAISSMLSEADNVANGTAPYSTIDDIFGKN